LATLKIVKGGTGKTSIASAFAVRASLFGLKVLCIDLDQQANLTQTFNIDTSNFPVMVDLLAEGYPYRAAINQVYPGLDLIGSRIENALLDEVIIRKRVPLDKIYRSDFVKLKSEYDLIVIDCPPNIGRSVAAATLAADIIVAPVLSDSFALSGLEMLNNTINELQHAYRRLVDLRIVLNKFDIKDEVAKNTLELLQNNEYYAPNLLKTVVRMSSEFAAAVINHESIFDTITTSSAQEDIDNLTRELLVLRPNKTNDNNRNGNRSQHHSHAAAHKVKYKVPANANHASVTDRIDVPLV
jgi:chromosome partitioning protein